ncbi:MAG: sortase domain-bontaining protein [Patescibacteria group bacterium]
MAEIIIYHCYTPKFAQTLLGKPSFRGNPAFQNGEDVIKQKLIKLLLYFNVRFMKIFSRLSFKLRENISGARKRNIAKRDFSLSVFFSKMAKAYATFGLLVLLIFYTPFLWYEVTSIVGGNETPNVLAKTVDGSARLTSLSDKNSKYQPRFDPALPIEDRLMIPAIGVDTELQEATLDNYEDALEKSAWRVSNFGTPYKRNKPTILVAHRYGYLRWSNSYRRENSFYNLPKLTPGNQVEIIWSQRKYVYEVYAEEKGEKISDYSADLILYTCESLNTPVRIFKYARLLEIQ